MVAVNKLLSYGLVTMITVVAGGCSPSATPKPEPSAASSAPAQAGNAGSRGGTTGCHRRIYHRAIEFG